MWVRGRCKRTAWRKLCNKEFHYLRILLVIIWVMRLRRERLTEDVEHMETIRNAFMI